MIEIDKEKCIQCGLCVSDCITNAICMDKENYPKTQEEDWCINCQHCYMICPTGALSFKGINPANYPKEKNEKISSDKLLTLIKNRRSIRKYKNEEIAPETFEKLKEMLKYIPTGCNSHALHFSIVENKEVMDTIRYSVSKKIVKAVTSPVISPLIKKFEQYKEMFLRGEDVVFRGAPHMIVVSSPITAPCASTDPIIALSYFELYAQSLGLGTCWCGYAQICVKLMPELSDILDIPSGYSPVYCMLLGIPDVKYQREPQPENYVVSEIKQIVPRTTCIFCKIKRLITNFLR